MHYVTAILRAQAGHEDTVAAALAELTLASRKEPGCLRYELFRQHNGQVFVTQETWVDEAAESAHMRGDNVATAVTKAGRYFDGPPDIHRCTLLV